MGFNLMGVLDGLTGPRIGLRCRLRLRVSLCVVAKFFADDVGLDGLKKRGRGKPGAFSRVGPFSSETSEQIVGVLAAAKEEMNRLVGFHSTRLIKEDIDDIDIIRKSIIILGKGLMGLLLGRDGGQDGAAIRGGMGVLNNEPETLVAIDALVNGMESRMSFGNHILLTEMGTKQIGPGTAVGSKMMGKVGINGVRSTADIKRTGAERLIGGDIDAAV